MIFRGCPSRVLGLEFAIGAVLRTLLVGCGDPAMGGPATASVSQLIWDSAALVSSTDETPTRKVVDIKGWYVSNWRYNLVVKTAPWVRRRPRQIVDEGDSPTNLRHWVDA